MKILRYLLTSLLALGFSAPVQAHNLYNDESLTLHGFGTLGLTHNNRQAGFIRDISQADGASDGWSADVDSRFGLQLGWHPSAQLDVVAQVISRQDYTGSYTPSLTWSFLRYQPDPDFQLRLGRVGSDAFMLAASRDVGYSYLWVRPPVNYYGIRHLSYIDGGDLTLKRPLGDGLLWGRFSIGVADEKTAGNGDITFDSGGSRVYGAQLNYEAGPWHLQLGYSNLQYRLEPSAEYRQLLRLLELTNPVAARNIAIYTSEMDLFLYSAGVMYSHGSLRVHAMLSHLDAPGRYADMDSAFITAGYRLGCVTPFVTLSGARATGAELSELGFDDEGRYGLDQRTLSLGMRYDVAMNLALKAQLDRVDVDQSAVLWRAAPVWNGMATIFSLSLDFVF